MFILYENLAGAVAAMQQALGANGSATVGVMPAFVLSVLHGLQVCASDHLRFLERVFQHLVATFWPLLLVTVGTALTRRSVDPRLQFPLNKIYARVDPCACCSTSK
jgi:hypothetical protein